MTRRWLYALYKTGTLDPQKQTGKEWNDVKWYAEDKQKRTGMDVLITDKTDFKSKTATRDREGHYTLIKGSVSQEAITIKNK